ncbi:discoidin domain-containing protein [Winogradskya humida]|uniref:F5/8 type C domain-containing protein n=1 Tax=Winogradskya humida TaxID=113566 RepID=A0ABQ4A130_9ACTN|nr:discoidin domain-containing protein [Actinoplanes humidus]GIE24556.1 hypothetical protein Ahu01nite_076580 [Actinoplanes humidus]
MSPIRKWWPALIAGVIMTMLAPVTLVTAGPAAAAPAPLVVDTATVIETRLQNLLLPALTVVQNTSLAAWIRSTAAAGSAGDSEVALSSVIFEAEEREWVDPASATWLAFKAAAAQLDNVNGTAYPAKIYIPNYGDGVSAARVVTMTYTRADETTTSVPGYRLGTAGTLVTAVAAIDETYVLTNEVWVLAVDENDDTGVVSVAGQPGTPPSTPTAAREPVNTPMVVCTPNGQRYDQGMEYLQRFKVPDPGSLEPWWSGKLEMRLVIMGQGGTVIKEAAYNVKRKAARNWVNLDEFITTWIRASGGDGWAYKWYEHDPGNSVTIGFGLGVELLKILKLSADVKWTLSNHDDMAGLSMVGFTELTTTEYTAGPVHWNVCSAGGILPENFSRNATATASTTYTGYAPERVNDGSTSTSLGEANSWANAYHTAPPQWVQVTFPVDRTLGRVIVYTTASYPIRDFDVQAWDGSFFVTIGQVRANTAVSVVIPVAPRSTRILRVVGLSGPLAQPGYVRVNELEAYGS